MKKFQVYLLLTIHFTSYVKPTLLDLTNPPEDYYLNFTQLAAKYGQKCEEYDVTTEDGYILKLFHLMGNKSHPVFLLHGLLDSADTFILRGANSPAVTLVEQGYDVWAGNFRGNQYSRRHVNLNPDVHKQFWNFSQHEIGYYDLPAMIDFVLKATGENRVSCVGHSQGNMVFYILGATRPVYNDKVKILIALAPIAFLHHVKVPISTLAKASPIVNHFYLAIGMEEVLGERSIAVSAIKSLCSKPNTYEVCATGGLFLLCGSDPEELEPEFVRVIAGHYPKEVSRKNLVHLSQVSVSKRFAYFDYGSEGNLKMYKSVKNTDYNLKNVTMKVALLAGRNDKLSALEDVRILRSKLPNVSYHEIKNKKQNHLDFVWGRNMDKYLFPLIFDILNK